MTALRGAAGKDAILPLGALVVLLVLLPATPSGRDTADLLIATGLLVAGSLGWLLALRWRGAWAVATAVALILHATVDPVHGRWLPLAVAPLAVAFAAITIGGRARFWWLALAGGIIAGPLRVLLYDPFLDPACSGCGRSAVALANHPAVARSFLVVGSLLIAVALAAIAVHRARPWLLVAACVAGASAWQSEAVVALAAIALGVIATDITRTLISRRRVDQLVRMFSDDIDLEQTLRTTLGDPTLAVAYWLDDEGRFAARTGAPAPDCAAGQTTTELRMGDTLVAAIHHDPDLVEVVALSGALDGPARIGLENECLAAQLASQTLELQRSRLRIVERGDVERQQLERDVHDGAQQHVLALGFDLRTELRGTADDDPRRPVLERCLAETSRALDALRELSHGLYPPSLEVSGLVPALRALAHRVDVDIAICTVPAHRLSAPVEREVFALVANAAEAAGQGLDVDITTGDSAVDVHIAGIGAPCGQQVVDRIAALGGTLVIGETTIEAVIPCAS